MLSEKLRANFGERLLAERAVLASINSSGKFLSELTGLTHKAIFEWSELQSSEVDDLLAILTKISLRLRLEYNVSNELFLGEEFDRLERYDYLLEDLRILIQKIN